MSVELEPCPFCGNDGGGPIENALRVSMIELEWRGAGWSVQCDKCTATMGYSDSEDEAVTAWNTRTESTTLRRYREALEVILTALMIDHRNPERGVYGIARTALTGASPNE